MGKNTLTGDKELEKLAKDIMGCIMKDLFISEDISLEDISSKEKYMKVLKKFTSAKFEIIIDHKNSILKQAEQYKNENNIELAKIFYAMFFEHTINGIIDIISKRKKWSHDVKMNLIRNINFDGKFSWLLELLELPKFNKRYFNIIKKIAEDRNGFIHYKYTQDITGNMKPEELKKHNFKISEELNNISSAIKYIKKYESKVYYREKKSKFEKTLKSHL